MNVVFDLDGTLIDSAPDIQAVANELLLKRSVDPLTLEDTRQFIGEGSSVFVSRMMVARNIAQTPEAHSTIHTQFLAAYEHAVDKAVFYPGVLLALEELRSAGHRLGLCTNKPEKPTRAVLRHMGLERMFDAVVAGGMVDKRKPAPDMLHYVIGELGEGDTLYVGDSEIDAETARRAEVPFALYTPGYRKTAVSDIPKDWAFENFDALADIVSAALKVNAAAANGQ